MVHNKGGQVRRTRERGLAKLRPRVMPFILYIYIYIYIYIKVDFSSSTNWFFLGYKMAKKMFLDLLYPKKSIYKFFSHLKILKNT